MMVYPSSKEKKNGLLNLNRPHT